MKTTLIIVLLLVAAWVGATQCARMLDRHAAHSNPFEQRLELQP
jgi:hypothetical protein